VGWREGGGEGKRIIAEVVSRLHRSPFVPNRMCTCTLPTWAMPQLSGPLPMALLPAAPCLTCSSTTLVGGCHGTAAGFLTTCLRMVCRATAAAPLPPSFSVSFSVSFPFPPPSFPPSPLYLSPFFLHSPLIFPCNPYHLHPLFSPWERCPFSPPTTLAMMSLPQAA